MIKNECAWRWTGSTRTYYCLLVAAEQQKKARKTIRTIPTQRPVVGYCSKERPRIINLRRKIPRGNLYGAERVCYSSLSHNRSWNSPSIFVAADGAKNDTYDSHAAPRWDTVPKNDLGSLIYDGRFLEEACMTQNVCCTARSSIIGHETVRFLSERSSDIPRHHLIIFSQFVLITPMPSSLTDCCPQYHITVTALPCGPRSSSIELNAKDAYPLPRFRKSAGRHTRAHRQEEFFIPDSIIKYYCFDFLFEEGGERGNFRVTNIKRKIWRKIQDALELLPWGASAVVGQPQREGRGELWL